ncbi:MAG: hypothetical protein ACI9RZ_002465, partial [Sphingobacteriales bacterium]
QEYPHSKSSPFVCAYAALNECSLEIKLKIPLGLPS